MRRVLIIGAVIVAGAFASVAHADTLRCGNKLIQLGANQGYVIQHCGEPQSKETFTEPVMTRQLNGTVFQSGETKRDVWRYRRGQGQFPAVLTFEMGVLKKLEFEK